MKRWSAPGPDIIHIYWLKHLTAVHERLAAQMNQLLATGSHLDWLTQERTVLVNKIQAINTTNHHIPYRHTELDKGEDGGC